jgi:hypothetical protein
LTAVLRPDRPESRGAFLITLTTSLKFDFKWDIPIFINYEIINELCTQEYKRKNKYE